MIIKEQNLVNINTHLRKIPVQVANDPPIARPAGRRNDIPETSIISVKRFDNILPKTLRAPFKTPPPFTKESHVSCFEASDVEPAFVKTI